MKKRRSITLAAALFAAGASGIAFSAGPIRLVVDNREIVPDVPPRLTDGRVLVPVRSIAEALGADVRWDASTRTVVVTRRRPDSSEPASPEPVARKYYPNVPANVTTPEMALEAYFDALSVASNLQPEQAGAAGGTVGMGTEPYTVAYGYWTKEWRNKHPFEQFIDSWKGHAHLELMKLFPAGTQNGNPRFFAEVRTVEAVGEQPRFGVFYYSGFFVVTDTPEGWRIADGGLEPENMAWRLGGHQPWLGDPVSVATVAGLGQSIDTPPGEPVTEQNADGTVTVKFVGAGGDVKSRVRLVRKEDGIWTVLETVPVTPPRSSGTSR